MAAPSKNPSANVVAAAPELRIDTVRLYRDGVGDEGVDRAALEALIPELRRVHQTLQKNTDGGLEAEYACLTLHDTLPDTLAPILAAAEQVATFKDVLIIGIGGSSLGAKAAHQALIKEEAPGPRLRFLENIDPRRLDTLLRTLHPETTAVIAISKSGVTMETVIQYLILRGWMEKQLGAEQARQQQWIVTDPERGWMRELAKREGITLLPVPPQVGGRFSVLTAVGLLPLATAGVDVKRLLAGSAANAARCVDDDPRNNPALEIAALFYLLDIEKEKRLSVMMPYADPLQLFGDWYRQLWAESLGKRMQARDNRPAGTLPIRALGAVDQHSQLQMYLESRRDKIFTFIAVDEWGVNLPIPIGDSERKAFPHLDGKRMQDVLEAELTATSRVITETGHPNMTLRLPALDAHVLGQLIDLYQRVTVYAGLLYGINPLDQPAVEKGKQLAIQLLSGDRKT